MSLKITSQNFKSEVLSSDKPVLIDFYADWCGPCRMLAPVIEEISADYEGIVKVGKVNVDEEPYLAQQFNVMSIPTLAVFKDGKTVSISAGFKSKKAIEDMIKV